MELSDIGHKTRDAELSNVAMYANTVIGTEYAALTVPSRGQKQSEEYYEHLRRSTNQNEGSENQLKTTSKRAQSEDVINKLKYTAYINSAILAVLFIVVSGVIVQIFLPKEQVHGNWSEWEEWGSCSVSCGMGMQSRGRTCTNPAPKGSDEHCFGHSQEYRLCDNGSCAVHGNWSEWEEWGSCSVSCGMGMQSRDRTCTNPAPKGSGEHCFGNSQQHRLCDTGPCGVNGNWSEWEEWGSCSVSCGMGMQSRGRTCTNPAPKGSGEHCFGHSQEYRLCDNGSCADYNVAFTATNVNSSGTSNTVLRYSSVYLNNGDAYNTTTGKFTCKIPGVYYFSVTLTKRYKDINSLLAYLRINDSNKLIMVFDPDGDDSNELVELTLTTSGTFHLNTNDTVYVYGNPSYFYGSYSSSFTGILVFPDQ